MQYHVALYVSDPGFRAAYIITLARALGASSIFNTADMYLTDLSANVLSELNTIIFDLATIPSGLTDEEMAHLFNQLKGVPEVVILNHGSAIPAIQQRVSSVAEGNRYGLHVHSGYVPESRIREYVAHLELSQGKTDLPNASLSRRRHSIPSDHPQVVRDLLQDTGVAKILNFIRGRIHNEPGRLASLFVHDDSTVQLPETTSKALPHRLALRDSIGRLETFLSTSRSLSHGALIVGEKGAGKTTLVHYAAQQYGSRDESFLFLPVDYQSALSDKTAFGLSATQN